MTYINQREIKAFSYFPSKNFSPYLTKVHFHVKQGWIVATDAFTLLIVKTPLTKKEGYGFYRDIHIPISTIKKIKMGTRITNLEKINKNIFATYDNKMNKHYYEYQSRLHEKNLCSSIEKVVKGVRSAPVEKLGEFVYIESSLSVMLGIMKEIQICNLEIRRRQNCNHYFYESDNYILIHRMGVKA